MHWSNRTEQNRYDFKDSFILAVLSESCAVFLSLPVYMCVSNANLPDDLGVRLRCSFLLHLDEMVMF